MIRNADVKTVDAFDDVFAERRLVDLRIAHKMPLSGTGKPDNAESSSGS